MDSTNKLLIVAARLRPGTRSYGFLGAKGSAQEQDSPKDDDPLLYERLLPLLEAWDEIPQQEQRRL